MMDRLQKKCVISSSLLHGLLVAILFAGAAFSNSQKSPPPYIEVVDLNRPVTDNASHGGNPSAAPVQPTPPAPPPPPPPVQPDPPKVVTPSPTPKVEPKPEPKVEQEDPIDKPLIDVSDHPTVSIKTEVKKTKTPKTIKVNLDNPINLKDQRKQQEAEQQKAEKEAAAQAVRDAKARRQKLASIFNSTSTSIADRVATSGAEKTVVDMPGQGGGQAFANYTSYIYTAYYAAWLIPEDVSEGTVTVVITVSRNGTISSSRISKSSSQPSFNTSIERALRNVKSLPPFPEGTKDLQRKFQIEFSPKNKQSIG